MTTSETIKNEANPKSTKYPSLLARCTAPFSSKQRNALEHDIQLKEPFRQYLSGDTVKGAVHMNVAKSQRITHLVLRLHGFIKVNNRAKLPGESISYDEALKALGKGRDRRGIEYFGNGFARLFEKETVLCGEGRVLGQYEFRFEMVLPTGSLPSAVDVSIIHRLAPSPCFYKISLTRRYRIVRTWYHFVPAHVNSDTPDNPFTNILAAPKAWLSRGR